MPVHEVAPGRFQFGAHGKKYRSRAAAEAQARAIYASGWREDQLRKRAIPLRASPKAETAYVSDLQRIMRALERAVLHIVRRELEIEAAPESRHDSLRIDAPFDGVRRRLWTLWDHMRGWVRIHVAQAFDKMAADVQIHGHKGASLIGVPVARVTGLGSVVERARAENVKLITRASQGFLDQVHQVLAKHAALPAGRGAGEERLQELEEGAVPRSLSEALQERAGVARSRAVLIARDQTTKLAGAVNMHRQTAAGVRRFRWSTSSDERVRPSHRAVDGKVFEWATGADLDDEDGTTFPGQPINCRCVAVPVIEELEAPEGEAQAEVEEPYPYAAAAEE